jgi:hypothetical protein
MDQPPAIVIPQKQPSGHDTPRYEVLPNGNVRIIYSPPTGTRGHGQTPSR